MVYKWYGARTVTVSVFLYQDRQIDFIIRYPVSSKSLLYGRNRGIKYTRGKLAKQDIYTSKYKE